MSRVALVLIVAAVAVAVVPTPSPWVEQLYSQQVYLIWQRGVTSLSSLVGFSLLDPLLALLLFGGGFWWWRAIRRAREGERWRTSARMLLNTVGAGALFYLLFVSVWGLNYRREPLTAKLDYDQSDVNASSLSALSKQAVGQLNVLYDPANRRRWPSFDELPVRFTAAFNEAQQRLGAQRAAVAGRPKFTLLSAYFQRAGIDGMMNPFVLEVLVNDRVLSYERPFLIAHEWAHLAGYANESEASFVGFLICLAGDAQSQYSAWLFVLPQLVRHLPEPARAEIYADLGHGPRQHLAEVAARLRSAVPLVRLSANRIYDQFLRANRVSEGIASYGLVVNLILGTSETDTWRGLLGRNGMISPVFRNP